MEDYRTEPRRTAQTYSASRTRSAPRKRRTAGSVIGSILLGIIKTVFTLLLIGVLTTALFYRTFMHYVDTVLEPEMDIDASAYVLKQSSVIYYQDKESGEWVELQKIHGDENRTLVDYKQIPDHVIKALVAIEDERFYEHKGVDWKRTVKVTLDMLTGKGAQGGSTITQQLIKNLTHENQVTIRRKILEIFRALRFHEKYSEQEILEMYLNLVYFGHGAHGIEAAAETYFGKHVEELSVAEGAAIVGITQNPWKYDPLRSDWTREQNRERQLTVLYKMNELGWLGDGDYARAKAEKMVFVGDEDYVETADEETSEDENISKGKELDSFFVEQVFRDVVDALVEKGLSSTAAKDFLYTGGYQIYCTLDPRIQEIVENVYADQGNFNYRSEKGEMLQSGMTVIDNRTHHIVAIAGRVGEREGAFEWSYAASQSQCGSAIKPLSVYAPAIDAGLLTAASVIDDYPVYRLNNSAWPTNAYTGYRGLITIQDALRISSNTTAVRTLEQLTPAASYSFMTEKLGMKLESDDLAAAGALALGGLTKGVSTIEMAGAYSTFASNGVYTKPRTFTEVRDRYGNVVLDSSQESWVAMKETTVYTINELLKNVVKDGGTGKAARFSGMTIAGKTGTTNSRRDKYFVGYTPYYTAAVWCGFPHPARIETNDNPAAIAWNKVMKQVHEGLEDMDFPTGSDGMVKVTVCNKTGLLAGSGCGETRTVLVPQGSAPTLHCDAHVAVEFCTESGKPAGEFCPEEMRETHYLLDLSAPNTEAGFGYHRDPRLRAYGRGEDGYASSVADSGSFYSESLLEEVCDIHLTPQDAENPDNPEDPNNPTPTDPNNPTPADPNNPTPTDPNNPGTTTPTDPTDPGNPVDWFENDPTPTDPNNPSEPGTGGEQDEYAHYLDEALNLNNP